jgi:hypothetical protein
MDNVIPIWQAELDASDKEALAMLEQIQHWLPFEDHFNSDFSCVDCRDGRIYYASYEEVGKHFTLADDVVSYMSHRAETGFMDSRSALSPNKPPILGRPRRVESQMAKVRRSHRPP